MKLLTFAGFVAGATLTILALRKCRCLYRTRENRVDQKYDIDELMSQTGM